MLGRKERRKKIRRKNNEERTHIRARARTHSCAFASVERPLTLYFVVGVFYASYCLSFSALFHKPLSLSPTRYPPALLLLTLDAPGEKREFFSSLFFFARHHYVPLSAIFEAFSPGLYHHRRYLWCKSKQTPSFLFLFFFSGAAD